MKSRDDEQLLDLLHDVRQEATGERPSARVEAFVLAEFRQRGGRMLSAVPWRARVRRSHWLAAAASLVVLAAAAFAWRQWTEMSVARHLAPRTTLASRFLTLPGADVLAPTAVSIPPKTFGLAANPDRAPLGARRDAHATKPVRADFVDWPGAAALPAFENGQLVRAELPVDALPLLGLETKAGRAARTVTADLIIGQDGLPRAVRLLR